MEENLLCFDKRALRCKIIKRLNRFTVLVKLGRSLSKAHITNTGRLQDLLYEGAEGYCFKRLGKGATSYRLFSIKHEKVGALIDTRYQEESFKIAIHKGLIRWLTGCKAVAKSPKANRSRLDYLLMCGNRKILVEVKSAVLRGPGNIAMYPDCPSLRGRRHIRELIAVAEKGMYAAIVFIAGFPKASGFTPYDMGDPEIRILLKRAMKAGVIIKSISMYYNPYKNCVILENDDLPVIL